jgi:hypothetical protein
MTLVGDHVGENAELYALGALDPQERANLERHLANCLSCTREVGQAEAAVAMLDDATIPQVAPPPALAQRIAASAAALAASKVVPLRRAPSWHVQQLGLAASIALVVGLGGGIAFDRSTGGSHAATRDEDAIKTIAASHFLHATFASLVPGAPTAKVLYARDGSWYYVIVDDNVADCHVVARSAGGDVDGGSLVAGTQTSTLFVHPAVRPRSLELVRGGRVIATATLARP